MTTKHKLEEAARKLDHLTMDSLWADNERLRAVNAGLVEALEYVLEDEPNLVPRASSSCRNVIRAALAKAKE